MGFVNKVMLMGNTTRDPELRTLPSGTTVCDFAMATNRVYKTTNGEEKQETVFIDCTAFGRTGEVIAEYCPKGRPLFIEGRLHYETWEDKSGNRRSKLSVIVENFQFVGTRDGGDGNGTPQHGARQRELPLNDGVRKDEDRPQKAPVANGSVRKVVVGGGDRFQNGQRPGDTAHSAVSPARASRKIAGKPARAAGGPAGEGRGPAHHGATATAEAKVVDQMADEAQELEDADLPF